MSTYGWRTVLCMIVALSLSFALLHWCRTSLAWLIGGVISAIVITGWGTLFGMAWDVEVARRRRR